MHTISHSHDISLVALSIAIAAMHLVLAFRFRTGGNGAWGWHKPASALLMGAAIPAMHYTGMATSQFSPASGPPNLTYALSISSLGISAVVGSALVLFLAIGASILHRRLAGNAAALSRFAAIVESSHDAIVAATLDGKVVARNPGAERLWGYREDEVFGRHVSLLRPADRTKEADAIIALIGAPGQISPGELVTRHSIAESRQQLKILLAEDNLVNQEVARAMLLKRGHQVDVVANGCDAVEAVRRSHYDLVLMDIQMPKMDGFAAMEAIRGLPGGDALPIFAMTAHAMSGERERCIARGMNGYLSKPFKGHELYTLVEGVGSPAPGTASPTPIPHKGSAPAPPPAVELAEFRRTMREVGAEDVVDSILDLFAEDAPVRVAALIGAVASGEGEEIARAAHAFKSPAGAIGARGLESMLLDMELAGKARAIDQARTAFDRYGQRSSRCSSNCAWNAGGGTLTIAKAKSETHTHWLAALSAGAGLVPQAR